MADGLAARDAARGSRWGNPTRESAYSPARSEPSRPRSRAIHSTRDRAADQPLSLELARDRAQRLARRDRED